MGYAFPLSVKTVGTTKLTWGMYKAGVYRVPNYIESLDLENTHPTQTLYLSTDGGLTIMRTIEAGQTWSRDFYNQRLDRGTLEEFTLWGSASATTFEGTLIISEPL
jgi:hypothetical protein